MSLPPIIKLAEAVELLEMPAPKLRKLARELGACRVAGRAMFFLEPDIAAIQAHLSSDVGVIYFLRCGPYIKIGYTRSLPRRLSQIRRAIPFAIEVLHAERGTLKDEAAYFERFKEQLYQREWFYHRGALEDFIWEKVGKRGAN
jgi:hypothetical protein